MEKEVNIIGISIEEMRVLIKDIVMECFREHFAVHKAPIEKPITVNQVLRFLGISRPTLNKYVGSGLIRRHDLGRKKKVFYPSELDEDIKRIKEMNK